MVGKVNVRIFQESHISSGYTSGNEFDPTWGREDAFYFLLAYYKGRKNVGDKELFEKLKLEALDKFPNDKRFNRFNY